MKVLQIAYPVTERNRALCIGIDSYTRAPLRGAVSDAERWAEVLSRRGFDVTTLTNGEATRARVLDELWTHVENARPGERIAVAFAGHGARDVGHSEDTAIVCSDLETGGIVLDDEIGEVMSTIQAGVSVTLFFDCCHSGTMSRNCASRRDWIDAPQRERQLSGDPVVQDAFARLGRFRRRTRRKIGKFGRVLGTALRMREVCFAACGDDEFAYEIGGAGVFTTAATALLEQVGGGTWTNKGFAGALENRMHRTNGQRPRLTCAPWRQYEALLGETARRRAA